MFCVVCWRVGTPMGRNQKTKRQVGNKTYMIAARGPINNLAHGTCFLLPLAIAIAIAIRRIEASS